MILSPLANKRDINKKLMVRVLRIYDSRIQNAELIKQTSYLMASMYQDYLILRTYLKRIALMVLTFSGVMKRKK